MLEAADVLKQSGKEFLSAVPKDHQMFEATAQVMNHIYWVNGSLKSLSPVNGMVQHVPISDFDCFDVGTPAPPAPPSPPSLPPPCCSTWAQWSSKRELQLLPLAVQSSRNSNLKLLTLWIQRSNRRRKRMMVMAGMKGQEKRKEDSQKN